jgi:hypothetical protein
MCVNTEYEKRNAAIQAQYMGGKGTIPRPSAKGEYGNHAPMPMMVKVVKVRCREARLPKKGTLLVLMMCTIKV